MKSWSFDSPDAEATLERGEDLARTLGAAGLAIALVGPLGAGKTVFVKGLARGLGVDPRLVSSPTFVIAQQYPVAQGPTTLHHVDLYRLEAEEELETIGFYDMLAVGNVVAVEWADRFEAVLGRAFLSIEFEGPSPEEEKAAREGTPWRGRRARAVAHGEAAERILSDWAARVESPAGAGGGALASSPAMRVLALGLLAIGLFMGQRMASWAPFAQDDPGCGSLISLQEDELGSVRALCRPPESVSSGILSSSLSGIARLLDGRAIDLNRASADLLERLPGIGPTRAAAIVRERARGEFASVRDLERVSGIGPGIRRALESWLMVPESERASASSHAAGPDAHPARAERDG